MTHPSTSDHGPGIVLAENGLGMISVCACGVLTLTVACVSLRLEPAAFQELAALIHQTHPPQSPSLGKQTGGELPSHESPQVH
jgi:hypothetical protein